MEADHDEVIRLRSELDGLKNDFHNHRLEYDITARTVQTLETWQKTTIMITVGVGALITFFAEQVKHVLGLKG